MAAARARAIAAAGRTTYGQVLFLASGYYQGFALNSGGLKSTGICDGAGHCINTNAFAVRCVLDLKIHYRPGFCSCARCGKVPSTALRSV